MCVYHDRKKCRYAVELEAGGKPLQVREANLRLAEEDDDEEVLLEENPKEEDKEEEEEEEILLEDNGQVI